MIEQKPYVVSADINLLMQDWANQKDFVLPDERFFKRLRTDFSDFTSQIFPEFELVGEQELTSGLACLVARSSLYPVSLDRVYYSAKPRLELTRQVNTDGQSIGLGPRAFYSSIKSQLEDLPIKAGNDVCLVDDVIFSGEITKIVTGLLEERGVKVAMVCAGIGIQEGIDEMKNVNVEVRCVRTYQEVIDEICERDFYPGVPFCGRTLNTGENTGMPYLLPFGNPVSWASIPEDRQKEFSRFCLYSTTRLFREIEFLSGRNVRCMDLDRKVFGLPEDESRFVDVLENITIM